MEKLSWTSFVPIVHKRGVVGSEQLEELLRLIVERNAVVSCGDLGMWELRI